MLRTLLRSSADPAGAEKKSFRNERCANQLLPPLLNQFDPLSERLRHFLIEFKCPNRVQTRNSIQSYSTAR
jgi:hypothetical protein